MRRVLVLVAIALVGVLFVAVPAIQAQATKTAKGSVTAVTGDQVTVKVGTEDMNFTIDPKTKIIGRGAGTQTKAAQAKGEAGAKLTDLVKVGQLVTVRYTTKDNVMQATEVRVTGTAPAPKK